MAKSRSHIKSQMRQLEHKQRQAINKAQQQIKKTNTDIKRTLETYNKCIRSITAKEKRNQHIILNEYNKLHTLTQNNYIKSVQAMQKYYERINNAYPEGCDITPEQERILDLITQEQANSLITANTLGTNTLSKENTEDIEIGSKLAEVSEDLNDRWQGAIYALNPSNPDAARHFCTSTREIFTVFLDIKAPDKAVLELNPECEKTKDGCITRRAKINYMMRNKGMDSVAIEYAAEDIDNIIELFAMLNGGTHGPAGEYNFDVLQQIKKRAEQGINFLCEIAE